MRRYAVVGLGAVGGLYGARLAAAGHEVHFLVRSSAAEVRSAGLELSSVDGDVRIDEPSVHERPEDVPEVDVVLVALKTTANDQLQRLLPPLMGPGTVVVMMQNGLGVEEQAEAVVGGHAVVGGLCFVCANRTGPGRIEHLDYGTVTLAEHRPGGEPAGVTEALDGVACDLEGSGVKVVRHPDLPLARWRKLVWNIPYNGLSVVLDAGTDELNAEGASRELVRALMQEVTAGAVAVTGREIDRGFVDEMLATTDAMTPYRTSMRSDFESRRPLELDAIYRVPIERARAAGRPLVRAEVLWRQLQLLDRRNRP